MMFDEIKDAAQGRCGEIIAALTCFPGEIITKKGQDHPCPQCGGKSKAYPDTRDGGANLHGRIVCRGCTDGKPTGDIIDTVKTFGGHQSQGEAAQAVANFLGLSSVESKSDTTPLNIIEQVAKAKRVSADALREFGAKEAKRGRDATPVARVPVYNERGEEHSYFDLQPQGKGFSKRGKGSSGLFLPRRLPKPGETWHLVEGVKDAAALFTLGLNAAGLPSSFMAVKYARIFEHVDVVIVPDLDKAGQTGAQRTGGHLAGIAASIKIARLPGETVATNGEDVRDVIRKHGEQAVHDAINSATEWQPKDGEIVGNDDRPEEVLTLQYPLHVDRTIEHLGRLGWDTPWIPEQKREGLKLYQRGGSLVEVVTSSEADATAKGEVVKVTEGTPKIRPLPIQQLPLRIAAAVQLVSESEKEGEIIKEATHPPRWLIDGIHTAGDYGTAVRHLSAIVTTPTIRPDGSILQTPGWDASGLLFRPSTKFDKIPEQPSQTDALEAAKKLFEVVSDFPFAKDADRSAWLAMLLSMIGRPCVPGNVPMFTVTANIAGAGKGLLIDATSMIAYGHAASLTTYPRDDNEMRKQITSIIMAGSPAVFLDNIDRPISGASLDAVLTAGRWKDRELSTSRMIDLPARAVWTATGNNLQFRSDIARRVLPIRLDSSLERPETRDDFRHGDLLEWVREVRAELVVAALTILRAYFVAGYPKQGGGRFGSFQEWSDIIRGAIVWAGCADPMETIETAQADDESAAVVAGLIGGLLEMDETGEGLSSREIVDRLNELDNNQRFPTMRDVVAEVATKNGKADPRLLGNQLRKYRNRVANSFRIVSIEGRSRQRSWKAERVEDSRSGDSGDSGDSDFLQPKSKMCCVSTQHTGDTHQGLCGDRPKIDSPHTPESPTQAILCPKCDGPMIPAKRVGDYRNWDCSTPGCGKVLPMRINELQCSDSDVAETSITHDAQEFHL